MAREWFHADADSDARPGPRGAIVNLRNILEAMDAVAEAQPVGVQARRRDGGRPKSVA